MSQNKKKYYNCFSQRMKKYLVEQRGHSYKKHLVHYRTGREFWVFELTESFSQSLQYWSQH